MASDPVLRAHVRRAGVYDLSGHAPAGIRDQLVRSTYLVDRLLKCGELGRGSRLLVLGAGAAGANVAVIAARAGVHVALLDRDRHPFGTQLRCATRWLDPVQYDWPLPHAGRASWPLLPDGPLPFGYTAGASRHVARKWLSRLSLERRSPGHRLELRMGIHDFALEAPPPGSRVAVSYRRSKEGAQVKERYDVVVMARGVQSEATAMPAVLRGNVGSTYRGIPFWNDDAFESPGFGLPEGSTGLVLVSGAGDGGLQDYIRLTTGRSSALAVLSPLFQKTPEGSALYDTLRRRVLELEHGAQRALVWNRPAQDHGALLALHTGYQEILGWWRDNRATHWQYAMNELARAIGQRNAQRVQLVHGCGHFGNCYPLNRMVALLVAEAVKRQWPMSKPIRAYARLAQVHPPVKQGRFMHFCSGDGCWGQPHEVSITEGVTCEDPAHTRLPKRAPADAVVVRHGVRNLPDVQAQRQVLPHRVFG